MLIFFFIKISLDDCSLLVRDDLPWTGWDFGRWRGEEGVLQRTKALGVETGTSGSSSSSLVLCEVFLDTKVERAHFRQIRGYLAEPSDTHQ